MISMLPQLVLLDMFTLRHPAIGVEIVLSNTVILGLSSAMMATQLTEMDAVLLAKLKVDGHAILHQPIKI
jgi:hypothetical protein